MVPTSFKEIYQSGPRLHKTRSGLWSSEAGSAIRRCYDCGFEIVLAGQQPAGAINLTVENYSKRSRAFYSTIREPFWPLEEIQSS
jgi:hypothetical protein